MTALFLDTWHCPDVLHSLKYANGTRIKRDQGIRQRQKILSIIGKCPEGTTTEALTSALSIHPTQVYRYLNRLEKAGACCWNRRSGRVMPAGSRS